MSTYPYESSNNGWAAIEFHETYKTQQRINVLRREGYKVSTCSVGRNADAKRTMLTITPGINENTNNLPLLTIYL